jgi:hypothetical protein
MGIFGLSWSFISNYSFLPSCSEMDGDLFTCSTSFHPHPNNIRLAQRGAAAATQFARLKTNGILIFFTFCFGALLCTFPNLSTSLFTVHQRANPKHHLPTYSAL